jgi:uncharacterized protein
MKLEQSFEVDAPLERVWSTLIDVERVAPCLPGADISGVDDQGEYRGTFAVKIGPATAAYDGTLTIEQADEASHTVTMRANGQDKRGQGSAKATIESRVTSGSGATRVDVVTDFTITGRLARIGRGGVMEDIANRLLGDFARCLESKIGDNGGDEALTTDEALDAVAADAAAEPTEASPEQTGTLAPANEPPNARTEPASSAPAAPVRGGSLLLSVLWRRLVAFVRRLFGRA